MYYLLDIMDSCWLYIDKSVSKSDYEDPFRSVATMSGRSLISVVSFVLTSTSRTASRWSDPTDNGSSFNSVEWHVPGKSGLNQC